MKYAPPGKEIHVAGELPDEQGVMSSAMQSNLSVRMAKHEESDAQSVLHSIHNSLHNIVMSAWNTDVLLLPVT